MTELNSVAASADVGRIDRDNLYWMIKSFAKKGLPTATEVGEHVPHLTCLLVRHADSSPDFQQCFLAEFTKHYKEGEFCASDWRAGASAH